MLITLLTEAIELKYFDCGEQARNIWLQTKARANQTSGDTRTYAATENGTLTGFYALTVGAIIRAGLPGAMRRNAPDPIGCVLLAQLGVALHAQGHGVGRQLILHAMGQAVKIAEIAGCRLFAVHPARPDLVDYYARFGFTLVETTPPVMMMTLKTVSATLAAIK